MGIRESDCRCVGKNGVGSVTLVWENFDSDAFCPFLDALVEHQGKNIYVLFENASWLVSAKSMGHMDRLGVKYVRYVVTCPDLNAIEVGFANLKDRYRRKRLDLLAKDTTFDLHELLSYCGFQVKLESIINISRSVKWMKAKIFTNRQIA